MPQPRVHASTAARQAAYRSRCEKARQAALSAKGLPSLPTIASIPGWARWNASLKAAHEMIANTAGEMHDYFDDRSEAWQQSERGEEHQERMDSVEAVAESLSDLIP